ncbi:hypothetical protein M0802_015018 [Mischocyttarus mexicanus]|nr:hypothetical protein M0802_015018 [Mischocyttarus mexicanus]
MGYRLTPAPLQHVSPTIGKSCIGPTTFLPPPFYPFDFSPSLSPYDFLLPPLTFSPIPDSPFLYLRYMLPPLTPPPPPPNIFPVEERNVPEHSGTLDIPALRTFRSSMDDDDDDAGWVPSVPVGRYCDRRTGHTTKTIMFRLKRKRDR